MVLYLSEALTASFSTILQLAIILIPIMILLEYAKHFQLLEKLTSILGWLPRSLSMSPQAAFPLIVGIFIGVTYGAAIIIEYSRQGTLNKRDMLLCGVFLAINHSIIEDNLLLAALGANLLIILPLRFVMAYLITRSVSFYLDQKVKTV
ncbi:nucleoside recognition domain-containing protein [Dethiobacter alkaliphilus]|uniref:Nucleoside recognition domain protein n=1 Tax=Dethiobacter alkaliphilus AHT 1 TaxID=555088 RepID=C0GK23_DETAL|nr:nucleoside recognition domain-containing protein [Dethiobacter alkaliphilus]EEG76293.1 nucleoside recognition domain protein [Dethiobacter alkaliphilus AHT 1]